jgi:hypothetical protein
LVIFGSGKKEHPWPRTLEGRTWSVKRVRVPDYTYMAHRIKMYILAFPGMCPVYGRYIGPKNRFEDSLKTCKDKLRSMLVIWWQLLHTKCFVYGVYTPYTVGRFFIFYYTTGVNPIREVFKCLETMSLVVTRVHDTNSIAIVLVGQAAIGHD